MMSGNPFSGYQQGSLSNIFNGLFGDASAPYRDASDELSKYLPQAQKFQFPFFNAGVNATNNYQDWLKPMANPATFINNLMGNYQMSPNAKYLTQAANRAATNAASASGLIGSTPYMQQSEQDAASIASGDMNNWLQNVLGINTQYGQGEGNLMTQGASSANALTNLLSDFMNNKASLAYGESSADQGQKGGLIKGLAGLFGL